MRRSIHLIIASIFIFFFVLIQKPVNAQEDNYWRSKLYPKSWQPGYKDKEGRFLHDFSYAGYYMGEKEIPVSHSGIQVNVTADPFGADNTGKKDATLAIQKAIDHVGSEGGGIVFLPEGTYRIRPPSGQSQSLRIRSNRVVLRGAGKNRTFLFNDEWKMRNKKVVLVSKPGSWLIPSGESVRITKDLDSPTHRVPVADISNFKKDDWIVLKADVTRAFIDDHGMNTLWSSAEQKGMLFLRRITEVDTVANVLTIDIPTRYFLLQKYQAHVYKIRPHIQEVGIENLSIGMKEHPGIGFQDDDWDEADTGAYEVHDSSIIYIQNAINCWVQNVNTFRPKENSHDWHVLSHGIKINRSRNITIRNCDLRNPQYRGGGGNGYLYILAGSECLIQDCSAVNGRHNYSIKRMWATGNVIHRCLSENGRLPSDFHMYLSVANLFDNVTVDKDWLEARYRLGGIDNLFEQKVHGHTTTQSVFWNTYGKDYHPQSQSAIIDSRQFGWGYVIGTRGKCYEVTLKPRNLKLWLTDLLFGKDATPLDYVEGIGKGDTLLPMSLYEDQLQRRLRMNYEGLSFYKLPDAPTGLKPLQCWYAMSSDPDGENIFIATSDHKTNAALYRFNVAENRLVFIGDAKSASKRINNWKEDETLEKFHVRPTYLKGTVYLGGLNYSRYDAGYLQKRGFHWYGYSTIDHSFIDLSAKEPGGVAANFQLEYLTVDSTRNVLYGAGVPTGHLVAYYPTQGRTYDLGRPPDLPDRFLESDGFMWVGSGGKVYFSIKGTRERYRYIHYYDPIKGKFGAMKDWHLQGVGIPKMGQWSKDRQRCYMSDNLGNIYLYNDKKSSWHHLGQVTFHPPHRKTRLITRTFQLSPDEKYIYMINDRYKDAPGVFLLEFEIRTSHTRTLLSLDTLDPNILKPEFYFHAGHDTWDNKGAFYMACFGKPESEENLVVIRVDPRRLKKTLGFH